MANSGSSNANTLSSKCKAVSQGPPVCWCGKKATLLKSWTFDNPGRRFLRCEMHGFCKWVDEENPHGWQRDALLEARDEIWKLKGLNRSLKEGIATGTVLNTAEAEQIPEKSEEVIKLETEIAVRMEKEKLLRQFLVISWGGFVAVTAIVIHMLK